MIGNRRKKFMSNEKIDQNKLTCMKLAIICEERKNLRNNKKDDKAMVADIIDIINFYVKKKY
jgi:hypothetical protein